MVTGGGSFMDIDVANEYPADPATVFAMFGDADFLKDRSEALGHTGPNN